MGSNGQSFKTPRTNAGKKFLFPSLQIETGEAQDQPENVYVPDNVEEKEETHEFEDLSRYRSHAYSVA